VSQDNLSLSTKVQKLADTYSF